jgi:hypothetical protein
MNRFEKAFAIFSLLFIIIMAGLLSMMPAMRSLAVLLPLAMAGVVINVGLLYIVFKDIFSRTFQPESRKYLWIIVIFLFLPTLIIYLPLHGFKPK